MVLRIAALTLLVSGTALCDTIIFTIQGTGSGTVGSTAFNNAAFTFSVTTNTALITSFTFPDGENGFETPAVSAAGITIGGFGSGTFTDEEQLFVSNTLNTVGLTDIASGGGSMDLLDGTNTALGTYNLESSIGPLTLSDIVALNQFIDVATSLGSVTFTAATNVVFTASEVQVPEPATWTLGGAGLAGLLLAAGIRLLARTG